MTPSFNNDCIFGDVVKPAGKYRSYGAGKGTKRTKQILLRRAYGGQAFGPAFARTLRRGRRRIRRLEGEKQNFGLDSLCPTRDERMPTVENERMSECHE